MAKYADFRGKPITKTQQQAIKQAKIKKYHWLNNKDNYSYYKNIKANKLGIKTYGKKSLEFHKANLFHKQHYASKKNLDYLKKQTIKNNRIAAQRRLQQTKDRNARLAREAKEKAARGRMVMRYNYYKLQNL